MKPDHLLDQAEFLIDRPGRPRQANLRRAVSAAYYAVFHFMLRAAADLVVGAATRRSSPKIYARAYRAIEHGDLRRLKNPQSRDPNITRLSTSAVKLQQDRHEADYDPLHRVSKADAISSVRLARSAITCFEDAPADEKKACLTLLLFRERKP
jgi:uncharacterized protein (UPF0332 family)